METHSQPLANMLVYVCVLLLFHQLPLPLAAQRGFKGILNSTHNNQPISQANVLLIAAKDSTLVKGTTTNEAGYFELILPAGEGFLVQLSSPGYRDSILIPPAAGPENHLTDLGKLLLTPNTADLDGVVVVARKPLFEQKIDRLIINVKASPTNVGNTVLEVLEKSPGVIVDRSRQSVAMYGKDGVNVMINGKISYMPQEAMVQLLNSLNAASVEKIELITVPPAKYDAGGNAGYINIVMNANPDEGLNGNYNLGMGIGKGTFPTAGLNFNYRKKQANIFGTYSFSRQAQEQLITSYRITENGAETNEATIKNERDPYQRNHNLQLGLDYEIGKKTVAGVLFSGFNNKWAMDATSDAFYSSDIREVKAIRVDISEVNHWKSITGNFNLQHTFREGGSLSVNTDLMHYTNDNPTNYINDYFNGYNDHLYTTETFSNKITGYDLFVANADYSQRMKGNGVLETGVKYVQAGFLNNVEVAEKVQGSWVNNPSFTGRFNLDEKIWATYFSYSFSAGKRTNMQAGLRYEYTRSNLSSAVQKNIVDRKYGNLFPTFYINHKVKDEQTLNLSYNRRIDRPSFRNLAPFIYFTDPKTFISGNAALQPAITDAVKLDYTLKRLVFSIGYNFEDNSMAIFLPETDTSNNSQVSVTRNLDYTKSWNLTLGLPFRVAKWWYSTINITGTHMVVKGTFNKVDKELEQAFFSLSGSQIFSLPGYFTIELKGEYNSKSLAWGSILNAYGKMDIALQKKFMKADGTLTLGVDNMLNTYNWNFYVQVPEAGIESGIKLNFWPVTYKIGWTQQFGNHSLRASRQRKSGGDDVRQRVER